MFEFLANKCRMIAVIIMRELHRHSQRERKGEKKGSFVFLLFVPLSPSLGFIRRLITNFLCWKAFFSCFPGNMFVPVDWSCQSPNCLVKSNQVFCSFFSLSPFSSPRRSVSFVCNCSLFFPFLSSPLVVLANNFDKEIAAYLRAIQLQPVLSERNWRNKQTHRPTNKTDIAISLSTK